MSSAAQVDPDLDPVLAKKRRNKVMWIATICFTLMFAVWLQFGVLSVPIKKELGLEQTQIAWLLAIVSLNGSVWRLFTGIMADRWGGRNVMVALMLLTVPPCILVSHVHTYNMLLLWAFFVGLSGNSFTIGISWVSAWFEKAPNRQGLALGVFGAGNVGASVTKMIAPVLLPILPVAGLLGGAIPGGWRMIPNIYAVLVVIMSIYTWFASPQPEKKPTAGVPLRDQLRPLKEIRVWRFSLYYVVVFGAYVALSGWMPTFYTDNFGLSLGWASFCTALYIFPASLLRPLGGWLSDKYGARPIMYFSLGLVSLVCAIMMVNLNVVLFTVLLVVLGVGMGIGKAAVYKHIPVYYPKDVGSVGGLVGLIGGLGAVVLPPLFAYVKDWFGVGMETATFGVLFAFALISLIWMHLSIKHDQRRKAETDHIEPVRQAS